MPVRAGAAAVVKDGSTTASPDSSPTAPAATCANPPSAPAQPGTIRAMDGGLGTITQDPAADAPGALRADYARYVAIARRTYPGWRAHAEALLELGLLAIAVYRFGRWARSVRPRLL